MWKTISIKHLYHLILSAYTYLSTHTCTKQINWANDIHMARTRCWCCYALMAEEHKGLFEAVTLILAAQGFCGSAALKPLLAICWAHQKQVNQHLHQHRTGIESQQNPQRHTQHKLPDLYLLIEQFRGAFLSKTFQKSFKGKVNPDEGIIFSDLITHKLGQISGTILILDFKGQWRCWYKWARKF